MLIPKRADLVIEDDVDEDVSGKLVSQTVVVENDVVDVRLT